MMARISAPPSAGSCDVWEVEICEGEREQAVAFLREAYVHPAGVRRLLCIVSGGALQV
jgi:hypothetical protein